MNNQIKIKVTRKQMLYSKANSVSREIKIQYELQLLVADFNSCPCSIRQIVRHNLPVRGDVLCVAWVGDHTKS